jgi:chromosomal replication initiator protein
VLALSEIPTPSDKITVRRVLKVAAAHFGIAVSDLISDCRKQPLCRQRQIAMYLVRELTGRSLPFIGQQMGDRDHTTILHGVP